MLFDGDTHTEVIREFAENLSDPVFLVDRMFNVWYYNRVFQDAVGVRMGSRRYKDLPCHKLLGLSICEENCAMKQAVEQGRSVRLAEIAGNTAGGDTKSFHINAIPLINSNGKALGALMILRDVTAEMSLQEKYKEMVSRSEAISLSGRIENGNLPDVLQLFSFLQKTGRLLIQAPTHGAEFVFDGGKVVYAKAGEGVTGPKAFARVVAWPEAAFEFLAQESVDVPERIETSSDFLLMDALREQDELKKLSVELPELTTVLRKVREAEPDADMLDEVAIGVLSALNEGCTVSELLDRSMEMDSAVYVALIKLRGRGIVEW